MFMIDKTGEPPTIEDVQEAIVTIQEAMTRNFLALPPKLAVELGNILRCLQELQRRMT
jgi:hypothetical protein